MKPGKVKNLTEKIIYKTERIFKTDMTYVLKNSFWLNLGQLGGAIIAIILSIIFANLVAPDIFGIYKYIVSIAGIISAFTLTGMGAIVIQGIASGQKNILKKAVSQSLRWSLLATTIAIIIASYYAINENFVLAIGIMIAGLSLPISNAFGLYSSYLNGQKNFRLSTLYWLASYLGISIFLIGIILLTDHVLWLITGYFGANLFFNWFFYKLSAPPITDDNKTNDDLLFYGKHLSLINLAGKITNQLDKILVFQLLGSTSLAVYSFAFAIPEQIKGSFKNLFSIALPKYANHDKESFRQSIKIKIIKLTIIATVITVTYIIIAPLIFKLLFPKYLASIIYSQIYMIGIVAIPGISLCGIYFQVQKKITILYKINIVSNLITIILTVLLIYFFGLMGAVIENNLSWFFILAINLYFFAKDRSPHGKVL